MPHRKRTVALKYPSSLRYYRTVRPLAERQNLREEVRTKKQLLVIIVGIVIAYIGVLIVYCKQQSDVAR